ncbi:L-2-hydroxyglutarate oxidase [Nostocoides sp. F2B08]|uniref:L-2-hydroxyglutarate oxidase n=1 Tax=Nostocoides sp. F2B08 TaxID=2653936 RepID=UPI001D059ABA|nr:L-2-hydroxyglutarate oxidase [Tetrasphaera sp. F2B08]
MTTVVVGGGIVGLAVARELTRRRPGAEVVVLEKEDRLAGHQSGHNSGVVHAGIYYRPGSLKAQLCTRGRDLLRDYCGGHTLPYDPVGKLVVAVRPDELARLDALERTATDNQVPGLRRLDRVGLREIEPHAEGLSALHSPATAITDFAAVARSFASQLAAAGGRVRLRTRVTGMRHSPSGVELTTSVGPVHADEVVVCAGLQADRLGVLAGGPPAPRIVPFRGEYLRVTPEKQGLVRGLIYPVPDPRYPFLGVHFTRMVDGSLEVGPNAVLATAREGYRRRDVTVQDLRDTATWPGTWQLARTHWRTGVRELAGSLSVRAYLKAARAYVPEIGPGDVVRGRAGVRAQAVDLDGTLVDDFRVDTEDRITVVRNAPSPAATSSLAIAEWIVDRMHR